MQLIIIINLMCKKEFVNDNDYYFQIKNYLLIIKNFLVDVFLYLTFRLLLINTNYYNELFADR